MPRSTSRLRPRTPMSNRKMASLTAPPRPDTRPRAISGPARAVVWAALLAGPLVFPVALGVAAASQPGYRRLDPVSLLAAQGVRCAVVAVPAFFVAGVFLALIGAALWWVREPLGRTVPARRWAPAPSSPRRRSSAAVRDASHPDRTGPEPTSSTSHRAAGNVRPGRRPAPRLAKAPTPRRMGASPAGRRRLGDPHRRRRRPHVRRRVAAGGRVRRHDRLVAAPRRSPGSPRRGWSRSASSSVATAYPSADRGPTSARRGGSHPQG